MHSFYDGIFFQGLGLSIVGGGVGAGLSGLGAVGSILAAGGVSGVITSLAIALGGSSVLMGLITAVGASAFLGRIAASLCFGDPASDNDVLNKGVCVVFVDAVRDFINDIEKNDSGGNPFFCWSFR